jgi:hypothetical protein
MVGLADKLSQDLTTVQDRGLSILDFIEKEEVNERFKINKRAGNREQEYYIYTSARNGQE